MRKIFARERDRQAGRNQNKLRPIYRRFRNLRRETDGVAALEFVIILPVIVMFTLGGAELVFIGTTYSSMLDSARDAARQLAMGSMTTGEAETFAEGRLMVDRNFTIVASDPAASSSDDVSVAISLPLSEATATRILPLGTTTLRVNVTMRKEV